MQLIARVALVTALFTACGAKEAGGIDAGLTAQEILGRTSAAYQRASAYQDRGFVDRGSPMLLKIVGLVRGGGWDEPFATQLTRTGACEFRFGHRRVFTATGDSQRAVVKTPYGPPEQFPSWRAAVGTIVGVTAGTVVPALQLFYGEQRAESVLALHDLRRLPDEKIAGRRCAVLRGNTPGQTFTLWIAPDYTIRRVRRALRAADARPTDVHYAEVTLR